MNKTNLQKITDADQYKQMLVPILGDIDKYCEAHKIRYCLEGGSLIGVVRHKGFIPWDDDIDIMMPRVDYEKFINGYHSENDRYYVISAENNKNYYLPFAKVCDRNTVLLEDMNKPYPIGAFVDVFPFDYFPSLKEAEKMYASMRKYYSILLIKNLKWNENRRLIKNCLLYLGKIVFVFRNRNDLAKKITRISSIYSEPDTGAEGYYAPAVFPIYGGRNILPVAWFEKLIKAEFEDIHVCIPQEYDQILTRIYGNYMQLPPESERVSTHGFDVWIKK